MSDMRELAAKHPELIPHGTPGGYCNWKCRCQRCRYAHNVSMKRYRRERMAATGERLSGGRFVGGNTA